MRSVGVDVPLVVGAGEGVLPFAVARGRDVEEAEAGERRWCCDGLREEEGDVGLTIVVLLPSEADSGAEGGEGRDARIEEAGRMEERQRKHSPVP